jgi:predicted  nucleic acid-binding Zn-ribbon protein
MIKENIKQLMDLQEIDAKIFELEQAKKKKPFELKQKENEANAIKERTKTLHEDQKKIKIEIDKKDLSIKEKEEKTAKLSVQLNVTKTNKEYSTLLSEISVFKADISVLEDEILKLYAKIEDAQRQFAESAKEVDQINSELNEFKQKVDKELQEIEANLAELYDKRKGLASKVSAEVLSCYERIIDNKADKKAIAQVVDESCQGCFMDVTPQEVNELMKGKEIIKCRSCSRILYL